MNVQIRKEWVEDVKDVKKKKPKKTEEQLFEEKWYVAHCRLIALCRTMDSEKVFEHIRLYEHVFKNSKKENMKIVERKAIDSHLPYRRYKDPETEIEIWINSIFGKEMETYRSNRSIYIN